MKYLVNTLAEFPVMLIGSTTAMVLNQVEHDALKEQKVVGEIGPLEWRVEVVWTWGALPEAGESEG